MSPRTRSGLALAALAFAGLSVPSVAGTALSRTLAGSGSERARAVAVDADGSVFVAGVTDSADFPVKGTLLTGFSGGTEAFLAKYDSSGGLVWSLLVGGTGDDEALALALDADGSPWVAGVTSSDDFPTQSAIQSAPGGGTDGFLAHVSADGTAFLYSTRFGGHGDDRASALAVDATGAWFAGTTDSDDLAVTPDAVQGIPGGGADAFFARISSDGTTLLHATFLGGSGDDRALGLALDTAGAATVVGSTDSDDFPLQGSLQGALAGGTDAFAFRIGGSGALLSSSLFGGSEDDAASSVAFDGMGALAIGGSTRSADFPVVAPAQEFLAGGADGFLLTLSLDASQVLASTFLGGSGDDETRAVAYAADGSLVAGGATLSADFPVRAAARPEWGGGSDGFVVRLAQDGQSLAYGSFVGGAGDDAVSALRMDGPTTAAVAGEAVAEAGPDATVARALLLPEAPTGLSLGGLSHLHVALSWSDPSGGRSSFEIDRRLLDGAWGAAATAPAGTLSWMDTSVVPASTYQYRMRAVLDGVPSDTTDAVTAITLPTPPPAAPGTPVLEVLSPTSIALSWEDRSADEITFEVFRGVDGGAPVLVVSLAADATTWTDLGVTAGRDYAYRVRSVGAAGPSGLSAAATASTPATFSLEYLAGKRVDSPKFARDSVSLTIGYSALLGGALPDPRTSGFTLGLGAAGGPSLVAIPAGASGWKERNGVYTWKSPKGSAVKLALTVDTVKGTIKLKASRLDLGPTNADALRVWFRSGTDAGSVTAPWTVKKPGTLVF
jgi:hypothetical protein